MCACIKAITRPNIPYNNISEMFGNRSSNMVDVFCGFRFWTRLRRDEPSLQRWSSRSWEGSWKLRSQRRAEPSASRTFCRAQEQRWLHPWLQTSLSFFIHWSTLLCTFKPREIQNIWMEKRDFNNLIYIRTQPVQLVKMVKQSTKQDDLHESGEVIFKPFTFMFKE